MFSNKQKTQEFNFEIKKDIKIDFEKIDIWLEDILKINMKTINLRNNNIDISNDIYNFGTKVLILYTTLIQAIKIPIFDIGLIKSIKDKDSDTYIINLEVGFIEHIPKKVYLSIINITINILINLSNRIPTKQNIDELFNILQTQAITPFSNFSGSGKSSIPILEAAYNLDIPFTHLTNGIYQLGWGSKSRRINRSTIDSDSAIGALMSQNKIVTALLLRKAGLPVPEQILVTTKDEALIASEKIGWPVVVKPADKDRGEGVTLDISNNRSLKSGFKIAQELSPTKQVIIEKQVEGVCCRIFIINGKILYAVKRLPKSIKADGINTIEVLIKEANKQEESNPPWKKTEYFPYDLQALDAIKTAGFTINSIPKKDQLVPLRKIESTKWGGIDENITSIIHPDNQEIALSAAKLFGLQVCGVDIITSDISIPWHKNGAVINEINYSPLLGGGDISKEMIPIYLKEIIKQNGRIPITIIIGDQKAMNTALNIQIKQVSQGIQSFISSHNKTITPEGKELFLTFNSLYDRCNALLFDTRVDAIILLVQTDEFFYFGLPIDKIEKLYIDSKNIYSWKNNEQKLSDNSIDKLIEVLERLNSH